MKHQLFYLVFFAFISCSKTETNTLSSTIPPVSNNPAPSPVVPVVNLKNYLQSSYDLQQSDVTTDLLKLRKDKLGIDNGWNILAYSYLDVNADGFDDIFMICSYGKEERTKGDLFIYRNGDYFIDNSYFKEIPSLIHPRKAIVGDFNSDKKPDIFIIGQGYDFPPFPGEYNVLLLSNSEGKYDLKKFDDKNGFFHGAASGDIDKDGDLDIFVLDGNYFGGINSHFLINDGKGEFKYSQSQIDINNLYGQYSAELIDINKDGFSDLIIGGHEMDPKNSTRIYWGSSLYKFELNNMTIIPKVERFGVVLDFDIFDIDGDGSNELVVNRTGGEAGPNGYNNFYNGWYLQIIKFDNKIASDVSISMIEKNQFLPAVIDNQQWIPWLRFGDIDKNGKIDLFSVKCSPIQPVKWELQNKKLVRIQ